MKTLEFTATNKARLSIPFEKITGMTEVINSNPSYGNCYISTGAESEDSENGWYVEETYDEVVSKYEFFV